MRLTGRDRSIVLLVDDRGALTRRQIGKALRFGSVSRVNAVLLRLSQHGYLARRTQGMLHGTKRTVYTLGTNGRELLGQPRLQRSQYQRVSDLFLEHRLAVNDVWLAFQLDYPGFGLTQWLSEAALAKLALGLVPDGYVEYRLHDQSFAAFLETDLGTETIKRFDNKVRGYLELAFGGRYERIFHRRYFRVLVVTDSDRRLVNLRSCIEARTDRIFWLATRTSIDQGSIFDAIWTRPKLTGLQSLTTP